MQLSARSIQPLRRLSRVAERHSRSKCTSACLPRCPAHVRAPGATAADGCERRGALRTILALLHCYPLIEQRFQPSFSIFLAQRHSQRPTRHRARSLEGPRRPASAPSLDPLPPAASQAGPRCAFAHDARTAQPFGPGASQKNGSLASNARNAVIHPHAPILLVDRIGLVGDTGGEPEQRS